MVVKRRIGRSTESSRRSHFVSDSVIGKTGSDTIGEYVAIFAAMSDPVRMDILLRIAGTGEMACTMLDDVLVISKSTISYHIKILFQARLIEIRKEGRYYFYQLRPEKLDRMAPGLLEGMLRAHKRARTRTRERWSAAAGSQVAPI